MLRPGGPPPADILAFMAAGRLAAAGQAAIAYDWDAIQQVQAAILGTGVEAIGGFLGWLNPPHFFFAVLPLAGMGYAAGWLAWVAATGLAYGLAAWAVLPRPVAVIVALAAPPVLFTASVGQNGLLVAALFGAVFALLDRRPVAAGIALGLLTIKPQFGLLLPVLLAASGRWRVFAVAAATAAGAMAASWAAFGTEAWLAFLPSVTGNAERMLGAGGAVQPRIQSVYAFLVRLTGDEALAAAGHDAVALAVAAAVLRMWLRRPEGPEEARAVAAMAASCLITPYVWGYDMPVLAMAVLFLLRAALRDGWLPAEKPLLVAAWIVPAVLSFAPHPLVGPACWLLLLALAWRRDAAWRVSRVPSGSPSAGT